MDVASGSDRHLDITFGLHLYLIAHPLFPYLLEKHLAIPISPFFHLLVIVIFNFLFSISIQTRFIRAP